MSDQKHKPERYRVLEYCMGYHLCERERDGEQFRIDLNVGPGIGDTTISVEALVGRRVDIDELYPCRHIGMGVRLVRKQRGRAKR